MPAPPLEAETAERQTLDEVREWHRGVADALAEQRASALRAVVEGASFAPGYFGVTERDVEAYARSQRRELDRLTVLNLVASAEASVRIDLARRVTGKLKDVLSKQYRTWFKALSGKRQRRPDFDEGGILDVLKRAGVVDRNVIGRFRECLEVRHWVGHGRFWAKPLAVDQLDPDDVYDRADALLRALPN